MIDRELLADLILHLELGVRGGLPSPEHAAQLLRRLRLAISETLPGPGPIRVSYQEAPEETRRRPPGGHPGAG